MLPVLRAVDNGKEHVVNDIVNELSNEFHLAEEDKVQVFSNGETVFHNRVWWARTYLLKAGLIESPSRGIIRITSRGREVLQDGPEGIGIKFLMQFPEFIEWRSAARKEAVKDLTVESLRKFIAENGFLHPGDMTREDIETHFEISARQFLEYAKQDLTSGYVHHLVNALSNVKRAIDCRADSLLVVLGLSDRAKKEKWNFPAKTETLSRAGIVAPDILRRIVRKRNELEHEYKLPKMQDVQDAIDVAGLFMEYTDRYLVNAMTEFEVLNEEDEDGFRAKLDYEAGRIVLHRVGTKFDKVVASDSDEYLDYLHLIIDTLKRV